MYSRAKTRGITLCIIQYKTSLVSLLTDDTSDGIIWNVTALLLDDKKVVQ